MNLVKQAETDLNFTLEDKDTGFGIALTFKDEQLNTYDVNVQTTDIGFFIDPLTGQGVDARQVEVSVRISTLNSQGAGYPNKNWTVEYTDTNNKTWTMSIFKVRPDRKLGIYNLLLEVNK
jgi:type V secretory pathway adhesin AidA